MSEPSNAVLEERMQHILEGQREIKSWIESFEKKSSEHRGRIYKELNSITIQTTKTNGRVTSLEAWEKEHLTSHEEISKNQTKSNFNSGKLSILLAIGAVIATALITHYIGKL